MWLIRSLAPLLLLLLAPWRALAQGGATGEVSGTVVDKSTLAPLEGAHVVLRGRSDSTTVRSIAAAKDGSFTFVRGAPGTYVVECSVIAHASLRTPEFAVGPSGQRVDLHALALKPAALVLDEVEVHSERTLFRHDVDRRVYNVDHDLLAQSSSASELLQNIPSVQVDIDGNVSLRGSSDVLVLVNGRKSTLMGASRADVLQQLPASSIQKIEVITNPSAKYTAEGTSGIINIVTAKGAGAGLHGDVTGHLGALGRHNESASFGFHPGALELFGNLSHRDDRRNRQGTDVRELPDTSATRGYREDNVIAMRPLVNMGTLGLTWKPDGKNTFELSGDYFRRRPTREGLSTIVTSGADGTVLTDHDRLQDGFELEREEGLTGAIEHEFAKEDHTLRIEANLSDDPQSEVAHFTEHWRMPSQPDPASDVALQQSERMRHVTLDYSDPLDGRSKFEAGYALELHHQDIRSVADSLDAAHGALLPDPTRTYRFRLDQAIQAAYGTYQRSFGALSVLAGLRAEFTHVASDLVTGASPFSDDYAGLYPTLHLTWEASAHGQYQLNYSRRIRRPESDDLNPFPEYTDPYNIDSGNPRLRPESIHSVEFGYRLNGDHFSISPTIYVRDRHDGFTRVTRAIDDSTFLRTTVNLASDRSAGFEPVFTLSLGKRLQSNVNTNVFWEQIDASNLGYAGTRSVVSWSGTINVTLTPRTGSMLETNLIYRSARLTPQGDGRASLMVNVGARQNVWHDRISLTLAVSDLLKTQRQESVLDVAGILQDVTTKRDAQVVYAGVTYHYGRPPKGEPEKKDKAIQYEDAP